jgi:hypothetical protein
VDDVLRLVALGDRGLCSDEGNLVGHAPDDRTGEALGGSDRPLGWQCSRARLGGTRA